MENTKLMMLIIYLVTYILQQALICFQVLLLAITQKVIIIKLFDYCAKDNFHNYYPIAFITNFFFDIFKKFISDVI